MAIPNQEAINTFISITGASKAVALGKLEEHGGDINAAVYAHFSEENRSGDRNVSFEARKGPNSSDSDDLSECSYDSEEEIIQAVIEASKREAQEHGGDINAAVYAHSSEGERSGDRNVSFEARMGPNSLDSDDSLECSYDSEEEMIRAAIEASKQEAQEHGSNLNAVVYAHFSEGDRSGDRNVVRETFVATHQDDLLAIDDPIEVPMGRNPCMTSQEAIDILISITGTSEAVALRQLKRHGYDLNAAVNAYFSEGSRSGDRNVIHETSIATRHIDHPTEVPTRRNPLSPLLEASMTNPFTLLDPHFRRSLCMPAVRPTKGASSELPVHQASSSGNAVQHNEIPNTNIHAVQTTSQALDSTPSASAHPIGDEIVEGRAHHPSIDSNPVDLSCPPVRSISDKTDGKGISAKTDGKKEDGVSSSCVICMDAPVEGACIPCGHMAGCMPCLNEIKAKKWGCPVCRKKIKQVIRLYAV